MKKAVIILLFISVSIFACKKEKKDNTNTTTTTTTVQTQKNNNKIEIIGNQIWVRQTPSTGKVIMKLDNGTKCKIIEKGKKETIKGTTDYWYKIEYKGKQGWVFGSQTNLKQQQQQQTVETNNTLTTEEINNFVKDFINSSPKNKEQFENFFINDSLFELYNPGAFIFVKKISYNNFFTQNKFLNNIKNLSKKIVYNKIPRFDMDSYEWKDKGLFVNKVTEKDILSHWVKADQGQGTGNYTDKILKEVKEKEKIISYKLTITLNDGIKIYFGKINNKIKIIAIDVSTNDA